VIAVDTSALVAISLNEPERTAFLSTILRSSKALVSTVSVVETKMVLFGRRGLRAIVMLDAFLGLRRFELTPPTVADMDAAYAAFVAFGKGSGHPAGLNFGDVFAYALAKVRDLPLLYKGDDFAKTDLRSAISKPRRGVSTGEG
jgi:ribonuclease VapC